MAKSSPRPGRRAPSKRSRKTASRKPAQRKKARTKSTAGKRKAPKKEAVSKAAIARSKQLEKLDAFRPARTKKSKSEKATGRLRTLSSVPSLKNASFPDTYIEQVYVSLDDPEHAMTLTWSGPDAASQETGPFHTSPGAGLRGLNCDNTSTSRRSGSRCTPKGSFTVEGFARRLNSDHRATYVTFFVSSRGIGLHYFPTVPDVAASHGCIRIQEERIARLIHDNARVDVTEVVVDGTWTKPPRQW